MAASGAEGAAIRLQFLLHLCYSVHNQSHEEDTMPSATFTLRVEADVKKRLEKLARSTGRSRSFLPAEALSEYLDVNQCQLAAISNPMGPLPPRASVPPAH